MASSAPKFASFRPKPKEPAQPSLEEPRYGEKRHKPSKGKSYKEETPPHEKHDRRRHHDASTLTSKSYFSDRRGDADIARYGTLNRYDVPNYRRCGYGNVLGLPGQRIDREYSTEKKIYMLPLVRQRPKRLLADRHAMKENKRTLRLIKVVEHEIDADRDFILLSGTGTRKRNSDSEDDQDYDAAHNVDYRGIDDKPDVDKADDPDTYYDSDTETAAAQSEVTKKNSELIRATRETPQSLQAWLDLAEHQEMMMKLDRATSELTVSDKQNLADVRISTYEEAVRKIGDNEASNIALQRGLLREARRHWDDTKLAAKWQDVLRKHPHSVQLWLGYLDFVQSTFATFKYEDCRAIFSKALTAFRSSSPADQSFTSLARLHLFIRLTTMIQEAGYQELALAVWQAVLEFSLLAPQELTDMSVKLQQFEEFWESEAPRIGEPDSKGWRHTTIDDVIPPTYPVNLEAFNDPDSVLEGFRLRENDSINKLRYPGRSTDEVGEDDPFHTIFFSDLKEYVVDSTLPTEFLVYAFLSFCGLPPIPRMEPRDTWSEDPYLQHRRDSSDCDKGLEGFEAAHKTYSNSPLVGYVMTSDRLLEQGFTLNASRLDPAFVRNALKLLTTDAASGELVAEYLLAFEARHYPTEVVKTAKRLLKERPSSLRLYNIYGLIETRRGNLAKANQVFGAALSMKSNNVAPTDRLELFNSWVWAALHQGDQVEALWRLTSPQGQVQTRTEHGARPDAGVFEKGLVTFRETVENALLKKDYACAVLGTSLVALLTYLPDSDVRAALEVHNNLAAWFGSHKLSSSVHAEIHAQSVSRLLAYHVTHAPIVQPALLRTALEPLLSTFPNNTILLSTYAANESRFSIDDRVRGNMHRVLNPSPTSSITTWSFAIHHETLKGSLLGSTSHSIRALYKRATDLDASGAHCSALWTMYLHFELAQLRKEQKLRPSKRPRRDGKKNKGESRVESAEDRVRETFYEGLKMLPWCKDFVMLAFDEAREVFGEEELGRVYGVMGEKELRIYTEVDGLGG